MVTAVPSLLLLLLSLVCSHLWLTSYEGIMTELNTLDA